MIIYRKCTSELRSFFTINTKLPADNWLSFKKILDDKIKTNQTQYNLGREAAKISALSFGELEKYIWLVKI